MEKLCRLFDKSRQGHHKQQYSIYQQAVEEHIVLEGVRKVRKDMSRIGCRKLIVKLEEQGIQIGRDALFGILRDNGLLVKRRRNSIRTTMSNHWLRKYPNLIRYFEPIAPHQLWVSDITYVETTEGFIYLFLITDAYSRKIIGYKAARTLEAINAKEALDMAIKQLPEHVTNLIHHSDRGIQYACDLYVKALKSRNIQISMTENGDPLENAIAERVNGILKDEWLYNIDLMTVEETIELIPKIIHLYNAERPHLSLNMRTPNVAHQMSGAMEKQWKNYYKVKTQQSNSDIL
jgi:transposase InsO family protein